MTAFNVAISAGHHPGAKGATYKGHTEYDEAVQWQQIIVDLLNERIVDSHLYMRAHLIGTGKLPSKVDEVNAIKNCDLAIEVHFNAAGDPNIRGCETLFYPGSEKGIEYAKIVQTKLVTAMQTRSRGIKEGWYKQDRPGHVDFDGDVDGDEVITYWLRKIKAPALILEPEFMGQIENIQRLRGDGCIAVMEAVQTIALEKHRLNNLPPEERPSGIR
jgi:hypothetical protein